MAIVFTSGTRHNAAPCEHFTIVVTVDGNARSFNVALTDVQDFEDDPISLRELFVRWIKYKRSKGASFASLIGQTIVS